LRVRASTLDPVCLRAVPGGRAQLTGVGADHVSQRVRVAGVALGPRHAVPAAEPGRLQRVDREHQVARRGQRRDPRPAAGLDPGQDLSVVGVLAEEAADQQVQLRDPGRALGQPLPGQHLAGLVHHLHVMMVPGPVITCEQPHQHSSLQYRKQQQPAREPSAT
jgi:hypothetical protein